MHRRVFFMGSALCLVAVALTSLLAAPTGVIAGRAVLADGRTPWAGAKVGLFPVAGPDDEVHEAPVREVQADRHGRFAFDKVPAGPWWVVARSATEPAAIRFVKAEAGGSPVTVARGRATLRGQVLWSDHPVATPMPRTTQVSGRVVSGGRPLAQREVALWFYRGGSVMSPSPVAVRVVTDADGRFTVVVPVHEECWVSAWPTLHPRQADLSQGQRAKVVVGQPVTLAEDLEIGQD